jgi:hypothetical protein
MSADDRLDLIGVKPAEPLKAICPPSRHFDFYLALTVRPAPSAT